MTDYLSDILDAGEDALERALRRTEDTLAGAEGASGLDRKAGQPAAEEHFAGEDRLEEAQQASGSGSGWAGLPSPAPETDIPAAGGQPEEESQPSGTPGWAEDAAQPLAGALEQADRSAAQAAALAGREQARPAPGQGAAERSGWMSSVQPGRDGGAGELETALRVDRAFRRDSRRYDGGFFLY